MTARTMGRMGLLGGVGNQAATVFGDEVASDYVQYLLS